MSYQAIVAALTDVRVHPNADRIKLATVAGSQVVVDVDSKDGDLGVFFPDGGQLSHEFLVFNELYNEAAIKSLFPDYDYSSWTYGFFSANRRVRAQSFRGAKSDGFWCALDFLAFTSFDITKLKAGDMFTELNGIEVCNHYYTPATLRAMAIGQKRKELDAIFPKHPDTKQLKYFIGDIPAGALIYVSEKLHGTAGRFAHTLETRVPTMFNRARAIVGAWVAGRKEDHRYWTHLNGSRNVILEKSSGLGFYATNEFRYNQTRDLELHKGEVLYFEIVGYVHNETPIMPSQIIKDKDLRKQFGPAMSYTYGCVPGQSRMFVYRITRLNEDGIETDLSWIQVEQRCQELGIETVPLVFPPFFYNGDSQWLSGISNDLADGPSLVDDRHIREGVVLRIESTQGVRWLKNKSWIFGVLEGYIKDDDNAVDIEEAA